jgi:hypothetical protein
MYKIKGCYQGNTEVIDETDTEEDAIYLVQEYQLAYGSAWRVWYTSNN